MNKNPFRLKKEPEKSPFNQATLIRLKTTEQGCGKFLFDHYSCETIGLNSDKLFSFILLNEGLILADLTDAVIENIDLRKEELNRVFKSKFKYNVDGKTYNFMFFNNSALYKTITEELEIPDKIDYKFGITILGDNIRGFIDDNVVDFLKACNITTFYFIEPIGGINNSFKTKYTKPSYDSFSKIYDELLGDKSKYNADKVVMGVDSIDIPIEIKQIKKGYIPKSTLDKPMIYDDGYGEYIK